jgi:predicted Zn finger-like uncharacterized protein
MLIVCPCCASQYTIDPAKVGTQGRMVRCARCRTPWFAAFNEATGEARSLTALQEAGDGEGLAQTISVEAHNERLISKESGATAEPRPRVRASRAKPRARPDGVLSGARRFPIGVAVLALALAITAVVGRPSVVKVLPGAAKLYALAGWPINLRGLAFGEVRSEISQSEGSPVLVVEGEIRNVARREIEVPPIQIAVRSAEGQPLYTWTDDPPRKTLESGEAAQFRARLAAPPLEGKEVLVRFGAPANGSE